MRPQRKARRPGHEVPPISSVLVRLGIVDLEEHGWRRGCYKPAVPGFATSCVASRRLHSLTPLQRFSSKLETRPKRPTSRLASGGGTRLSSVL